MNIFQIILSFMGGIFFILFLFHFIRSVFVIRHIDSYFYFFLVCLFCAVYVGMQLLGSHPLPDETALLVHRLKLLSLGLGCIFWMYMIFDVCFKKVIFGHIYAVLTVIFLLTITSEWYLTYPIQNVQIMLGTAKFTYYLGVPGIMYKIHGGFIVGFTVLTLLIGLFTQIGFKKKVFLFFATTPIIFGGIHDYAVMYHLLNNILLSEYVMFLFILLIFFRFMIDELNRFNNIDHSNKELSTQLVNRNKELELLNRQLKKAAATDQLTGLDNRVEMENKIKDEIKRGLRYHKDDEFIFAILFIDLDNFKYFNDSFGHLVGDVLLKKFAELLLDQIRDIDHAGRFGGDEFVIILPETSARDALHLVDRISRGIKQRGHFLPSISRYISKSHLIPDSKKLNCSIGISEFSSLNKKNMQDLLREADDALYLAKRKGKNQAVIWQQA